MVIEVLINLLWALGSPPYHGLDVVHASKGPLAAERPSFLQSAEAQRDALVGPNVLKGVVQLAKLDEGHALVIQQEEGVPDSLVSIELP